MRRTGTEAILGRVNADEFVGRQAEIEQILALAERRDTGGIAVLASPAGGASEVLRQAYDRLFYSQNEVIPIYFELRPSDRSARRAAARFVSELMRQAVAFRRGDARILATSPGPDELAVLAPAEDGLWLDHIAEAAEANASDDGAFMRACLSAPARAASSGVRLLVLFDALEVSAQLEDGEDLIATAAEMLGSSGGAYVLCGHRRYMYPRTGLRSIEIGPLGFEDAGRLIEGAARLSDIEINDQTRDLIAVQLGRRPGLIVPFLNACRGRALTSFELVQQHYTDELFGGTLGRHFDRTIGAVPGDITSAVVIRLLSEVFQGGGAAVPAERLERLTGANRAEVRRMLARLHEREVIDLSSGRIFVDRGDTVLGDYTDGRRRLEVEGERRALVVGRAVAANVKRAAALMAHFYRRRSALGLKELLAAFDGRTISSALLDHERFRREFRGAPDDKAAKAIKEDNTTVRLPRIVFSASTAAFYPGFERLAEAERSAVGLGFDTAKRTETAWLAAEIDSKLEAGRELTEFWIDRLRTAAEGIDAAEHTIWLIAPEGFTDEAHEMLRSRGAIGTSRRQAEMLAAMLNVGDAAREEDGPDQYEFVIPMGDDTEMIAARTIEDVARRHGVPAKTINQIKTAVVEACINAAEHGHSPDRRIHQRFVIGPDRITITVANRGIRLADKDAPHAGKPEGRRGWGLKLIRGLMDEVRLEETDDGTRLTMVKLLGDESAAGA